MHTGRSRSHRWCTAHSNHKMAAVYLISLASGLVAMIEVLQSSLIQNDSQPVNQLTVIISKKRAM